MTKSIRGAGASGKMASVRNQQYYSESARVGTHTEPYKIWRVWKSERLSEKDYKHVTRKRL